MQIYAMKFEIWQYILDPKIILKGFTITNQKQFYKFKIFIEKC